MITPPTYQSLKALYQKNGYKFYESGQYNTNLFGIRNSDLSVVDQFNDLLGVAYLDEFFTPQCLVFQGTTKPGLLYLRDRLGNPNGTAIVIPGSYPGVWMCGFHHRGLPSQYPAYEQKGTFRCHRDNILNGVFDMGGPTYTDGAGINGHHAATGESTLVGGWSSACQVCSSDKEHAIWFAVGQRCAELYGNSFTYTLFQDTP